MMMCYNDCIRYRCSSESKLSKQRIHSMEDDAVTNDDDDEFHIVCRE